MSIFLASERLLERLRSQPETGMTYQMVTVTLKDGRRFERVMVVERTTVCPFDSSGRLPFDEADIVDLVVTHDRSGPPVER
jgi:hypothetical protein